MGRPRLTYKFIKEQFISEGYTLLSNTYKNCKDKLSYICNNNHQHNISWDNWNQGHRCPFCAGQGKVNILDIKNSMAIEGYILLTNKSLKDSGKYKYSCNNGHINYIRWGNWRMGRRCPKCYALKTSIRVSGKGHPNWKGGITPFNIELRNYITSVKWSSNVFKRDKYTCKGCNTKGSYLEAHHIVSLQVIKEDFNIKTIDDAKKCGILHDISNGKTFCKKCHKEYHDKLKQEGVLQ